MHILALHSKKKKNVPLIIEGYLGLVGFRVGELGNLLKAVNQFQSLQQQRNTIRVMEVSYENKSGNQNC